jgi:hypothetical protein
MSDLLNTNGSDFEFNPDAVDSIDQGSVEGGGPSYPVIQWAYGNMRDRKSPKQLLSLRLNLSASQPEGTSNNIATAINTACETPTAAWLKPTLFKNTVNTGTVNIITVRSDSSWSKW